MPRLNRLLLTLAAAEQADSKNILPRVYRAREFATAVKATVVTERLTTTPAARTMPVKTLPATQPVKTLPAAQPVKTLPAAQPAKLDKSPSGSSNLSATEVKSESVPSPGASKDVQAMLASFEPFEPRAKPLTPPTGGLRRTTGFMLPKIANKTMAKLTEAIKQQQTAVDPEDLKLTI